MKQKTSFCITKRIGAALTLLLAITVTQITTEDAQKPPETTNPENTQNGKNEQEDPQAPEEKPREIPKLHEMRNNHGPYHDFPHNPIKSRYRRKHVFMAEFQNKNTKVSIIKAAQRFFPTKDAKIPRELYQRALLFYLHGAIHGAPIEQDLPEDRTDHLFKIFVEGYMHEIKRKRQKFGLKDFLKDIVRRGLENWISEKQMEHAGVGANDFHAHQVPGMPDHQMYNEKVMEEFKKKHGADFEKYFKGQHPEMMLDQMMHMGGGGHHAGFEAMPEEGFGGGDDFSGGDL